MLLRTLPADHKTHVGGLCHLCWTGYAEPCTCGGFIHNEYDHIRDDDPILNYECSQCQDSWDLPRRPPTKGRK